MPIKSAQNFFKKSSESSFCISVNRRYWGHLCWGKSIAAVLPLTVFGWFSSSCLSACNNTPSRATEDGHPSLAPRSFSLLTRRPAWVQHRIAHCAVSGFCRRCTLTQGAKGCWKLHYGPCWVGVHACSCTSLRMVLGSGTADPTSGRLSVWKEGTGSLTPCLLFPGRGQHPKGTADGTNRHHGKGTNKGIGGPRESARQSRSLWQSWKEVSLSSKRSVISKFPSDPLCGSELWFLLLNLL